MNLELLVTTGGGVIAARDHRRHHRSLARAAEAGLLIRVLRGIYVGAGLRHDPGVLVRAVQTAYPDAIFTGATAAWLNQMTTVAPQQITAMHRGRSISTRSIQLAHGVLPDQLWVERSDGLRVMTQIMTAIDVIPTLGADLVDLLMRKTRGAREALLDRLRSALHATAQRPGNQERHRILARSTTNPWSAAERILHDLLDAAGVTGWVANHELRLSGGQRVATDVLFRHDWVAVEFDGYEFHSSPEAFRRDRRRGNLLLLDGWQVLHFTWDDLLHHSAVVVQQIKEALQLQAGGVQRTLAKAGQEPTTG